ncbi:uncharacterized protein [Musca autumnalis]|uniref:uncharacterized protein n=1 Tax=Musca autumnalis TaxID=221902 RepID=UPI003CF77B3D
MRLLCLLVVFHVAFAGENTSNADSTKQYLDLNDAEDNAFLWKNLFIKLNKVVEATEKFEENFKNINTRFDELAKTQNEQESRLPKLNANKVPESKWTTILRRQDASVNFDRRWNEYKNGFGNPDGSFFIGLEMLHRLTTMGVTQELLVVLVDYENETRYARYDSFRIDSEEEKYAITELGSYTGDAGNGMSWHKNRKFSTIDQDNNAGSIRDCPNTFKGGWWFHDPCYSGHLHGPYRSKQDSNTWGVSWDPWRKWNVSLKYAAMMIRPKMQKEQEGRLNEVEQKMNANKVPESQWTTILRRQDASVNFDRLWNEYKNGFGNPDGSFFIGLEMLHRLTTMGPTQELLVVLVDYENETRYARYDSFRIGSEEEKYAITELGSYTGDAGNGMSWHKNRKFSTIDEDNNAGNLHTCPETFKGGWWFHDPCYSGHLHGPYRSKEDSNTWGVSWDPWRKWNVSLKYAAMMIRPKM